MIVTTFWDLFGKENDHFITEIWRLKWTNETDPSARKLKFYKTMYVVNNGYF